MIVSETALSITGPDDQPERSLELMPIKIEEPIQEVNLMKQHTIEGKMCVRSSFFRFCPVNFNLLKCFGMAGLILKSIPYKT